MKIAAFGDIHMKAQAVEVLPPLDAFDLVIVTGDFTNFGGKKEAKEILEAVRKKNPNNILAIPGNMDHEAVLDLLKEEGINLHGTGVTIGEVGIFGCGGSNLTPFNTPMEFSDKDLWSILEKAYEKVKDAKLHLMVCHTPPKETGLDKISSGAFVGSEAVREFIERSQPALCLTGHIHEAKGEATLGKTKVINPGMVKDGGWVEVEILDDLSVRTVLH